MSTHLDVHDQHDDEMQGIRALTRGYALDAEVPFAVRVLYEELQAFERKLQVHAKIEDELLFPKAAALEKEVERILTLKIKAN
ncbi:hemerythrin domain-containing protein [Nitritalea halalkaliphila]|uniref:hemerythrin domain-containing protein n=1 Tax=Nitritalea halalkaliphila TaxID=590849 RepID=UPI0003075018|nr:hemerythrin domain-containing protein [Nitritalea halalkaliphila]